MNLVEHGRTARCGDLAGEYAAHRHPIALTDFLLEAARSEGLELGPGRVGKEDDCRVHAEHGANDVEHAHHRVLQRHAGEVDLSNRLDGSSDLVELVRT